MMPCPECMSEMFLVDNGDPGPIWKCACGHAIDYHPDDLGEDDSLVEEWLIKAHEGENQTI